MKKLAKVLSLGFLVMSLGACSCNKEKTIETVVNNSSNVLSGDKTSRSLTTQDIYKYIRENEEESVNKDFLRLVMGNILDLSNNQTNKLTYDLKIKQYFQDNYLNSDTYKINNVFNEDLLAYSLEADMYVIDKVNSPTSGPTKELGLSYDYSDYIKRALDYDIYLEMLKENYILNNKQDTLNNSKTRIISVFSTDDLEEIETIVSDLFDGKYSDLEAVAASKRAEEIEEIGRQYCVNLGYENEYYEGTCSASTSSSTYDSALYKFTVCENGVLCSPSEGLAYQIKLINEKEYVTEQIVNKNTTDILYEDALNQLFRDDVTDHLHKVLDSEDKFLINGLYNHEDDFFERDIILSDGSSNYYLVTVRVVDSNTTSVVDKEKALSLLLDKVSDTAVLLNYLENLNIDIQDPELEEYYNSLIGK